MRSVSISARRLLAIAGATALAVTLLAAPGNAAPALGTDTASYDQGMAGDPLRTIAAAYRTSHPDLSPEAARTAAAAQQAGEAIKAEVTTRWDTFGGGWFDPYTATYHLAVTTADTAGALAQVGQAQGVAVETPLVGRSLDQLQADADALRTSDTPLARAAGDNVGVDVTTNQVVASVPAHQIPALAGQVPAGVTVIAAGNVDVEADVCTSRANCDNYLAAGLVIRNGDPGAQVCSLGFTARNSANQRITLTAGHCSTNFGQTWSNGNSIIRVIGNVSGRINAGAADVTRIAGTSAFYDSNSDGRIAIGASSTVAVNGDTFLINGDVVCLSASFTNPTRSGNPCGTVTDTSDAAVRNMVRIEGYDACGGDSGGGWYWLTPNGNRFAVALHSRSTPGCNATPAISWASPITAFYPDLRFNYETS